MSLYTEAQTKYIAGYEGKIKFNFSGSSVGSKMNWKLTGDTSNKQAVDSVLQQLSDSNFLRTLFSEMLGETTTIYLHIEADSVKAFLESNAGNQLTMRSKMKYEDGIWQTYNAKKDTYERNEDPGSEFSYTGQSKKFLDYTCYEARSADTAVTMTIWVCKDFPATISPGIKAKNINYAIFAFDNPGSHIVIKSFKKYPAN